jgi:hypothetical protein
MTCDPRPPTSNWGRLCPSRRRGALLLCLGLLGAGLLALPSAAEVRDPAGPPRTEVLPAPHELPPPPDCLPPYLPRYDVDIDLDIPGHQARVCLKATWTNPHPCPTRQLVFNAHSRYVVPDKDVGLVAKTLELLRVAPGEAMGIKDPALEVHRIALADKRHGTDELAFTYGGDTLTDLVVELPCEVKSGESVTVVMDITMHLPQKQGRWGQWAGVTYLSNWLPVFAYYGDPAPRGDDEVVRGGKADGSPPAPRLVRAKGDVSGPSPPCGAASWQPTPFIPWHQPFLNEAAVYHVRVCLPCDQKVACTGTVVATAPLPEGRQRVDIEAVGVRDFAFLCSARYQAFEGKVPAGPGVPPIRVHVLAFPKHEFYAREMVRVACDALLNYCKWFGPYPYADFTIAEAFFGWNGNECSTLVMIDERVFAMPHVGAGYVEYLVSHETCHQWWYNLIGTNGYCETWMDEAMANYFSHRLLNQKVGRNNALMKYPRGLEWLPNIRREDYRSYGLYGTIGRGENCPVVQEMPKFGHLVNLFNMCYDKGGRVVGMIEERLGECAFMDFVRRVATRYRYRILRVADFRRELEEYTGLSWRDFFHDWLYGSGLCDWCVEKVEVEPPPKCVEGRGLFFWRRRSATVRAQAEGDPSALTKVVVWLRQKAEYDEQTVLGIALPNSEGYPVRIPIFPQAEPYSVEDMQARVERLPGSGGAHVRVEVLLPAEPTQVAVDPDQVLVDKDPSNNFWKPPVRVRVTPVYTFLEETDLTNAYDRWNVLLGPWVYGSAYNDAWYTRSTMLGFRAGLYRTQVFQGGAYAAYRTDFRDVLAGVDGQWDHWPGAHFQVGFNAEQRLTQFYRGDDNAFRAVLWGRYVFLYGSSLYLPPAHYLESFGAYQDNFFPFVRQPTPLGERFDRTSTAGLHYRINYLTPYWDPEGGFQLDALYEGGVADLPEHVMLQKVSGQLTVVHYLPDLSGPLRGVPRLHAAAAPVLEYLADTRVAVRLFGGTSVPTRGEFFTMGGGDLFRGFDLAERQGSTVWVGSLEWRVPLAKGLSLDAVDHVVGLRNVYGAVFYDVGDAYLRNRSVGPVAHAVGAGLRLDVAWFGFVERTTLRLDVAKAVNGETPVQVWFGVNHPF